ncbi:hypothetical protein NT06LI_3203, partial [Listeria innocua FSL J1-023]
VIFFVNTDNGDVHLALNCPNIFCGICSDTNSTTLNCGQSHFRHNKCTMKWFVF